MYMYVYMYNRNPVLRHTCLKAVGSWHIHMVIHLILTEYPLTVKDSLRAGKHPASYLGFVVKSVYWAANIFTPSLSPFDHTGCAFLKTPESILDPWEVFFQARVFYRFVLAFWQNAWFSIQLWTAVAVLFSAVTLKCVAECHVAWVQKVKCFYSRNTYL